MRSDGAAGLDAYAFVLTYDLTTKRPATFPGLALTRALPYSLYFDVARELIVRIDIRSHKKSHKIMSDRLASSSEKSNLLA
jgi:hypothetical protein